MSWSAKSDGTAHVYCGAERQLERDRGRGAAERAEHAPRQVAREAAPFIGARRACRAPTRSPSSLPGAGEQQGMPRRTFFAASASVASIHEHVVRLDSRARSRPTAVRP